jgi:hypothetical protein
VPVDLAHLAVELEGWGRDLQQRLARLATAPIPTSNPFRLSFGSLIETRFPSSTTAGAYSLLHLLGAGSTAFELLGIALGEGPHPLLLDNWLRSEFPALAARRDRLAPQLQTIRNRIAVLETGPGNMPGPFATSTVSARLGTADASNRQDLTNRIDDLHEQADRLLTRWAPTAHEISRYLGSITVDQRDRLLFATLTLFPGTLPPWLDPYRQTELRRLRAEEAVATYMGGSAASVDAALRYMDGVALRHGLETLDEQRMAYLEQLDPRAEGFWEGLTWGLVAGPYAPAVQRSTGGTLGHLLGEVLAGELVVGDVRDLLYDLSQRDYGMAGVDLLGLLPWVGSVKHRDELAAMVRHHDELLDATRRADPLTDITDQVATSTEQLATYSATLREAKRMKGDFGLGTATADEADLLGLAWVGPDYVRSTDGTALLSADGLRQYRPPARKDHLGIVQANLEQRYVPSGKWQANGHLLIINLDPGATP